MDEETCSIKMENYQLLISCWTNI